tara:strand:- start:775 stop:1005 length:231 start_codon:yes stop_codon:yes gene_type:complete
MSKDMSVEEQVSLAVRLAVEAEEAKRKEGQRVEVKVYDTLIDGRKHMRIDAKCVDINEGESEATIVDVNIKESDDA